MVVSVLCNQFLTSQRTPIDKFFQPTLLGEPSDTIIRGDNVDEDFENNPTDSDELHNGCVRNKSCVRCQQW